jgi:hypothetical protein
MSAGVYPKRQHFDNLSYISDGRDRISYNNDPYAISSRDATRDGNSVVLQPTELKRPRRENNTIYTYRPGQDNIYAYNNAAFRYFGNIIFFFSLMYFFIVISVVSIHVDLPYDPNMQIYMLFKNLNIIKKVNSSFFIHINNELNYK